jgi:hypothetical protein
VHQIGHRFGLRQIQTPAQERAQRVLARARQARARGDQRRQHAPRRHPAAMTREFHRVLARVGTRRAEHRGHHLVEHMRGSHRIAHPAMMQRVTRSR